MKEGNAKVSIRTVDTDMVVLAMTSAQRLNNTEIWIAFGNGKCFRFIPVHEIARALGLIGVWHYQCSTDTVSICKGRGKRTVWDTWKAYDDVTQHFVLWRRPQSLCRVLLNHWRDL